MKPLLASGLALIATIAIGLALHVHQGPNAQTERHVALFVGVLGLGAVAYLAACAVVTRADAPDALWLVLGVAMAMRAMALTAPPFLSSDLYRYVWDGRVQDAGINPYRFVPADEALANLRDAAIYPHVNRRDYAPTIYPPTAQLVFASIASISQTAIAFRLAAVGFESLAVGCLLLLLRHSGQNLSRVLIYAWNPLAVWDYAGNGHVDALAIGLIPLALLARATRRDVLAGIVLAAAILVKFLPASIAPALWRRPRLAMPLACALTIAALYAIYAGVGVRVLGFLGSYGQEEGIAGGHGIWLLAGIERLAPLPPGSGVVYLIAAGSILAALAWRVTTRSPERGVVEIARDAGLLAGAAMLVISPHYPWYFPWLALFATIATSSALIWLSVAPLLLYLDPLHEFFFWPSLIYIPALALAARDARRLRRLN